MKNKKIIPMEASPHLLNLLEPRERERRLKAAAKVIKASGLRFDCIAYRGASGAITASILGYLLKKPICLVRKPEDKYGHSPHRVEGPKHIERYLISDDFMYSGATYEAIREAIKNEHPDAVCLGQIDVTYALGQAAKLLDANEGPWEPTYSREHEEEMERDARIAKGQATFDDKMYLENLAKDMVVARYEKKRNDDALRKEVWREHQERLADKKVVEKKFLQPKLKFLQAKTPTKYKSYDWNYYPPVVPGTDRSLVKLFRMPYEQSEQQEAEQATEAVVSATAEG